MNPLNESINGSSMASGAKGIDAPATAPPVGVATGPADSRPGSVGDPGPRHASDWDALDRIVQDRLSDLTARVVAQEPATLWKAGRTANRASPLLSYRVYYHLDGDDYDPIIVGLTFKVGEAGVRVDGDISGDESGYIYFDEDCSIDVPDGPLALREAARAVAERLASRDSIVLEAIRNRHPHAVPR